MVRVSGLDVPEGHDESYHGTKADYRQTRLAAVQTPPLIYARRQLQSLVRRHT